VPTERVAVDAGPLIALLSQRDAAHDVCAALAGELPQPLITSWTVLAEAAWLLRHTHDGLQRLMLLVSEGIIACPPLSSSAAAWIADREKRYRDLRPQLADLTLLYLAETEQITTVFTLDRRDFLVFRDSSDRAFRLIP
jgi:predicted nucleic acid-binding protein